MLGVRRPGHETWDHHFLTVAGAKPRRLSELLFHAHRMGTVRPLCFVPREEQAVGFRREQHDVYGCALLKYKMEWQITLIDCTGHFFFRWKGNQPKPCSLLNKV